MKYAKAMLATTANPNRLVALCEDDAYYAEQKVDGHRCMMHVQDGQVRAITRNWNEVTGVPQSIFRQFDVMVRQGGRWIIDGEWLNGTFYVFDVLCAGDQSFLDEPYENRRTFLENFFPSWNPVGITLLPVARTHEEKIALAQHVMSAGCEGLVFKKVSSVYYQARSECWWRVKFRNTIDCFITELNSDGHHNIVLSVLLADGKEFTVGECTAEAGDGKRGYKFKIGDIVEVTYQYASDEGKLIQPTLPRVRKDKSRDECTYDQLVFANREVKV